MKVFLACILLALGFNCASASCSSGSLSSAQHTWSCKVQYFCEYEGMKFLNGSNWVDAERCQSCTCSDSGLTCCGIGFYAGTASVPGCEVVADRCDTVFLNMDKTALCHETRRIKCS